MTTPPTHTTPEPTAWRSTPPPQPTSTLPPRTAAPIPTPPPPEVIPREHEVSAATQISSDEDAATPSMEVELMPVTGADGLSGDLEPVMPLMISETSPLEEGMDLNPSNTEGTLSLAEPPASASSGLPVPTAPSVGEEANSESTFDVELTQTPTLAPLQDSPTKEESSVVDPEVLRWSKEVDSPIEGAERSENSTATFSAPPVLSGDGEVDHGLQSYPHLVDTDSELDLDYQYDQADTFLPVSSPPSVLLLLLLLSFFQISLGGVGGL